MTNEYCVYMLTNTITGKLYIGLTKDYGKRMYSYSALRCSKQLKLYSSIKKYGWINFESEIISNNLSLKEANEVEIYLISYFQTQKNGYNISAGGGCRSYSKGIPNIKRRILTSIQEDQAVGLYENGLTPTEIGIIFNVSRSPIDSLLKRKQIIIRNSSDVKRGKPSHRKMFSKDEEAEIVNLSKSGISKRSIAKIYFCSDYPISRVIKEFMAA